MKILVCGGRDYSDYEFVKNILSDYKISLLIHGDASGADFLAKKYCIENKINFLAFPADWKKYGKSAGPIRNQKMIEENPDLVIAFPGGKGTNDMIFKAKSNKVDVLQFFIFEDQIKKSFISFSRPIN